MTTQAPPTYTIENNKFYKLVKDKKVEFRSLGATLYPAHAASGGVIERAITNGIKHGHQTTFRSVLMFEGYSGTNPLNAPSWRTVKTMLQIGKKYNVGITVEVGSALLSWLERQGLDPYDKKYDEMFDGVLRKACRMYGRFTTSSLFCFTVMNEFGPYRKSQEFYDSVYRRMQLSAALIKKYGKNRILVGSGGLLHLSRKSGGLPRPFPTCPWINNGETNQVYWEGVYTCPNVDFNMIHIYANSIQVIESDDSEWSNLEFYYDFSSKHGKPFVVDEFGMRLKTLEEAGGSAAPIIAEGTAFLRAVQRQLVKVPKEKVPPIIEFWNLNSTSIGFDWWPESNYHRQIFQKDFQEMEKAFFACPGNGGVKFNCPTFQLRNTQTVLAPLPTGHKTEYAFTKEKLGRQLFYSTEFDSPVSLTCSDGICFTITSKIPNDQFKLKIRFHLGLQEADNPNNKKRVLQSWNSLKQNDIIPHSTTKKNEMFVDFVWGDIQEFGSLGKLKEKFQLRSLSLELICLMPKENVVGNLTIKNIRLATK